ncbi:MAG: carbon-nitrogen hydrolase family protein [Deltaproteobacteria bacterium]|nr:carbon-nitrogen hydrolase family protein [Deltaproteobacteria bacterium]
MKLCVVQTKPVVGDVQANIENHKKLIARAASCGSEAVFFPELSLTGYEPKLAKDLASDQGDARFDDFQEMSDSHRITIGVGMPIKSRAGILIGLIIFQPDVPRQTYCKQYLHSDELPYFVCGHRQVLLNLNGSKIAPAICYESLLPVHSEAAARSGANIYVASVAKSARGIQKAEKHFAETARRHSLPILMSNCVGPCDDFLGVGTTSVWGKDGTLLGQLDETGEGLLIFDTDTQTLMEVDGERKC